MPSIYGKRDAERKDQLSDGIHGCSPPQYLTFGITIITVFAQAELIKVHPLACVVPHFCVGQFAVALLVNRE